MEVSGQLHAPSSLLISPVPLNYPGSHLDPVSNRTISIPVAILTKLSDGNLTKKNYYSHCAHFWLYKNINMTGKCILVQTLKEKFHSNPFIRIRDDTCGRTDKYDLPTATSPYALWKKGVSKSFRTES
jgi:hypothetical protein